MSDLNIQIVQIFIVNQNNPRKKKKSLKRLKERINNWLAEVGSSCFPDDSTDDSTSDQRLLGE